MFERRRRRKKRFWQRPGFRYFFFAVLGFTVSHLDFFQFSFLQKQALHLWEQGVKYEIMRWFR